MELQFYKVEEAAKILNTKTSTVRTYCREGKIPAIKVGRGYRIAKEDLERWLKRQRKNAHFLEEARIEEEREKYRTLFENASDAIALFDTKGHLTLANPRYYDLLGYTPEEMEGIHFTKLVAPADLPLLAERFMVRLAGEDNPSSFTTRVVHKNGQLVDVESSTSLISTEGEPSGLQVILRDVTERKKAEKQIRFLSKLLETSPLSVIATDEKEEIIYINSATRKLYGYKEEELIGRNPGMLNAEPEANGIQKEITSTIRQGKIWKGEVLNRKKNGDLFYIQLSVYQLLDENGDFVALIGFQEDINERKKVKDALKESEQKFRILAEESPNIIFIDKKDKLVYINKRSEELLGYKAEEMYSPDFDFLFTLLTPKSRDFAKDVSSRFLRGEEVPPYETSLISKEGGKIDVIVATKQIEYQGERCTLGIITDITERKKAEEALAASEEKYRNLVENSLEGIGISKGNQIVYANEALLDIFGYESLEEFTKVPLMDLVTPKSQDMIRERLEQRKKGKSMPSRYQYGIVRKDGEIRELEISTYEITIDGETHIQGTFCDITERKKAEEALRESEEMYKALVRSSPEAVTITNLDGHITQVSKRTLQLFGYKSAKELVGRNGLGLVVPEEHEKATASMQEILKKGIGKCSHYTLIRADGTRFVGEVSSALVKDAKGQPKAFITTTREISAAK